MVGCYERVLGRPLDVRFVPHTDTTIDLPPAVRDLLAAQDAHDTVVDMRDLAAELDLRLTPLEAWVRASVATSRRV